MRGFLAELSRRNVPRVGALYLAAGWLVLQIADVLTGLMGLPEWSLRLVAYLLVIGFPFALILAWLFEVTPEGVRRTAEVDSEHSIRTRTGRRIDRLLVPILLLVIAGLLVDRLWVGHTDRARVEAMIADRIADEGRARNAAVPLSNSLAVLPFSNLSATPEAAMLADGIHEQLISELARGDRLRVLPRSATTRFRDEPRDLREVGRLLGAGMVLEGSLKLAGERVRFGVQLVEPAGGELLWAQDWALSVADPIDAQARVASAIAAAVQNYLAFPERARVEAIPSTSLPAYQLYLRAMQIDPYSVGGLRASVEVLEQAVALDPDFALAWAELSRRYGRLVAYDRLPYEALRKAEAHASRALAIDPELAEGRHALGLAHWRADRPREGRDALLAALRLRPDFGTAMTNLSLVELGLGRYDQSLFWAIEGLQRSPDRASSYYHVGLSLLQLAEPQFARAWLEAAAQAHPGYHRIDVLLALLELRGGENEAALGRLEEALASNPDNEELLSVALDATLVAHPERALPLAAAASLVAPNGRTWYLARSRRACHGFALLASGNAAEGEAELRDALGLAMSRVDAGADAPALYLELGAIHAALGELDAALEWLARAYQAGWRDVRVFETDPFLDALRPRAEFRQLLDRVRADYAGLRRRSEDLLRRLPPAVQRTSSSGTARTAQAADPSVRPAPRA
jgi:TolB-like protein